MLIPDTLIPLIVISCLYFIVQTFGMALWVLLQASIPIPLALSPQRCLSQKIFK